MTVTLRRLGPDDWVAFRAVRLTALADAPGHFFASLADAETLPDQWWRDLLGQANAAVFGAFDGEALVGITAVFTDRDDPSGQTAALGMTWLAPAHRGAGVSRLFYAERIAWARAHGHRRIAVGHRASNLASGAAMRGAGFRLVGREARRWPDGSDDDLLNYELRLDA